MARETNIAKGVESAWDFWLSQHEVSVPDTIHQAVKEAWTTWLNLHTGEILDRIQVAMPPIDPGADEDQPSTGT